LKQRKFALNTFKSVNEWDPFGHTNALKQTVNYKKSALAQGGFKMKTALTTGFLSLLIAAMPTAAETVHTPAAQSGAHSWIPAFAASYAQYVSAAPEPLRLVMVGSGMILFAFVVRMVARKGAVATTQI
jgi:hypothetical protein